MWGSVKGFSALGKIAGNGGCGGSGQCLIGVSGTCVEQTHWAHLKGKAPLTSS